LGCGWVKDHRGATYLPDPAAVSADPPAFAVVVAMPGHLWRSPAG
jgi:hypothetical protein